MMSNNLPKNNHPKLKWWQKEIRFPKLEWWQKGALVALIVVFLFLLLGWTASHCVGDPASCLSFMLAFFLSPLFFISIVYLIVCLFVYIIIKFRGTTRIILITIAAILIMAGIYYSFPQQVEKAIYKLSPEISVRIAAQRCQRAPSSEIRDRCYLKSAENLGLKVCEKMAQDKKDQCYLHLVKRVEMYHTLEFCGQIESRDEKDFCYLNIAVKTEDSEFCEKIESKSTKEQCFKVIFPGLPPEVIQPSEPETIPSEESLPEIEILVKGMAKLEESFKNLQSSFFPAIKNLAWRVADSEIIITGHAETREDVLRLKEALEKIPQLTEVECPISNLVKTEDIDFTFTGKFKNVF